MSDAPVPTEPEPPPADGARPAVGATGGSSGASPAGGADAATAPVVAASDLEDAVAPGEGDETAGEPAAQEPAAGDAEAEDETPTPRRAAGRSRTEAAEAARARALPRFARTLPAGAGERAAFVVDAFEKGLEPAFLGRFRREATGGLDERRLLEARDAWRAVLSEEERRVALSDLLAARGASTDELRARLDRAEDVHAMEDLAAPWLPVSAGRATVARGQGLQALADAIRLAKEAAALSDLVKPFVKEGTEIATNDAALGGARDVLAETLSLDADLRARLRDLFRRESVLSVSLRTDRKGDAGRHANWIGFSAPAHRVPPLKLLAIRRGERERVLSVACEPPEPRALEVVHRAAGEAFGTEHPHAGFLRAAAEDGYRRILRPLLQVEMRAALKRRADEAAIETFERSLKNLLLGPVGGPRKTLGLRPDVTGGHRACAVDEVGRTVYAGRLPHEATAGREAAVATLRDLLEAHGVEVVAVGSGAGRREASALAEEAAKGLSPEVRCLEVFDGGTRALETQAVARPVLAESGIEVPAECVGALSLARRFQDPMAEYVRLDPKSLGLGPSVHDVHQGRLRERLDDTIASCVAHVGVDPTTASAELLARLPGFDAARARAFVAWRDAGGRLAAKAAIGAVEGVGLAAAEQAVGFLRVGGASDPRDRTQLHPEQFGLVDGMAAQVGTDVAGLFRDPRLRARVDLARLSTPEAPMPVWKYALWQATAGLADPRPRHATATKPPPDVTLETLRPGLVLEGRVTRAVPFGVFVDVGLPAEALVPLPHVGDRPGTDPAFVAPVGAVVQARVLEVDVAKRRITLSMRSAPFPAARDDRPPRGGGRPERRRDARPSGGRGAATGRPAVVESAAAPPGGARPAGAPATGPGPERRHAPDDRRGTTPDRRQGTRDRRQGTGDRGSADGSARAPRRSSDPPRRAGAFSGGGRGGEGGRRFDRDDPGAPRRISLPADASAASSVEDESALTPEQVLARKLEELKRRIARPESRSKER